MHVVRATLKQPFNTPHLSGCSTLRLETDLPALVVLCIVVGVLIILIQASFLATCSFVYVEKLPLVLTLHYISVHTSVCVCGVYPELH